MRTLKPYVRRRKRRERRDLGVSASLRFEEKLTYGLRVAVLTQAIKLPEFLPEDRRKK